MAAMSNTALLLVSFVVGMACGFVVCIPVGPINVTIVNEGAKRGFRWAFLIGMGAVAMEVVYCALGFASFVAVFNTETTRAIIELVSFALMLFLGLKYALAKELPAAPHSVEVVEERLHPHSAFMTGFVRVLGNPATLLLWMAISAGAASRGWVRPDLTGKSVFVLGVGLGAVAWFLLLSYIIGQRHKKIPGRSLLIMSRVSGVFLLLTAAGLGIKIVRALARHVQEF